MGAARFALPVLVAGALAAQDGGAILENADRLRNPWSSFSVEVTVKDAKGEQRWRVRARENGDARVEGLSEKEKGRTVLLLGENMWLLLPNTRRPVKVSPAQRLLGPAAGGDLARSRFAQDYEVKAVQECDLEDRPCHRLDLQARRPSLSYRTARLWVLRASGVPLKAEYFLASGKWGKTAHFEAPVSVHGRATLPGLRLVDPSGAEASLAFSHWNPGPQEPALFELPSRE